MQNQLSVKICKAEELKKEGNQFFKIQQYKKALRSYHQAHLYVAGIIDKQSPMAMYTNKHVDQALKQKIDEIKFSLWMNMSQIYIKQSKFQKSMEKLTEASKIKQTTKLKYRKALTYYNLGDYDRAKDLFTTVCKQDLTMTQDISMYLNKIKQIEKANDQKSKRMFQKFFTDSQNKQ